MVEQIKVFLIKEEKDLFYNDVKKINNEFNYIDRLILSKIDYFLTLNTMKPKLTTSNLKKIIFNFRF